MKTLWRQWRCVVAITLIAASILDQAGARDRGEASAAPSAGTAADWRQFRGPDFGRSHETGLPLRWDDETNIVWRTPLPGPGSSSPIVADDRIYVTCYSGYAATLENLGGDMANLRRHLVCINAASGDVVWDTAVVPNRPDHGYTGFLREHGYASSSPTADGQQIYVYFGNSGAYAFDLDGHEAWRADCGERSHGFGSGASPILFEDLLIVNASVESARLFALDSQTGDEVWQVDDVVDAHADCD